MIEKTVRNWHRFLRGEYEAGLDGLLHDDCVFYSPVVFTPQRGKAITKMYLTAAGATLGEGPGDAGTRESDPGEIPFRYVKEIFSGDTAVLEFERTLKGKYINGIDMITCDDEGRIIEFKVMIRPLQAVNLLHEQMAAMLEKMGGAGAS
ncbi:MAG TPA: nuclear transport factor 2 family protein [Deltaproteobacteria bacterium]|nr:nuclear transport factor 2 family protein [Deltaproteobacteria bacterium]